MIVGGKVVNITKKVGCAVSNAARSYYKRL
jgi:hypothetical protein